MNPLTTRTPEKKKMTGPTLEASDATHAEKYRQPREDFREAMGRVASALADNDTHYQQFRDILLDMRYLPAGRIQAAMGTSKSVTAFNCYVSGTIEDSFVDGNASIMNRAKEAATTMRMGGGIGYDFSRLRPRGDIIRKLGSQSSGPVSFMEIFNAVCNCVASSGHRRGAQMAVMRVDHPDIEEFIRAKQNNHALRGFNVSVGITDEFMKAVETGELFPLQFGGKVYREVNARQLWETIMRSTYDWAEPGVLFLDTINKNNNLFYAETIEATNPCGEQPLPPYGACLLGSINLTKYVKNRMPSAAEVGVVRREIDYAQLAYDLPIILRAMDNVIDRTRYPLEEQEREAQSKRRIGIGITGAANAIEALGYPYGSPAFCAELEKVLQFQANVLYKASAELSGEKGPFPAYRKEYMDSLFVQKLAPEVRRAIAWNGIRNSHLTSIAPTGTISFCADNVSSGIEPVFAYTTERTIQRFDGPTKVVVPDYGYNAWGVEGKRTSEVTIQEHLDVLEVAAKWVDSAVSKTCNVPTNISWTEFKDVYMSAWKRGAKGITTYRPGGKREEAVLVSKDEQSETNTACTFDPETGIRSCEA